MTPKEKAEEFIRKYYTFGINKEGQTLSWYESKQCTLIAVDEILEAIEEVFVPLTANLNSTYRYWKEVKQEIKNL